MFTGIIEATGTVSAVTTTPDGGQICVAISGFSVSELTEGESIAVNGCCLTATDIHSDENSVRFDLLGQTLKVTNLGDLNKGSVVNIERAMQLGDRLSGHIVQGHVDATGELVRAESLPGDDHLIEVKIPPSEMRRVIDKGSICLDGISLTAAEIDDTTSTVRCFIIPHTWSHTRLHALQTGERINLEFDLVGKWIERFNGVR